MKKSLLAAIFPAMFLLNSCMVAVNNPDDTHPNPQPTPNPPVHPVSTRTTAACFPFENNTNWWHYTESGGNVVSILVTDTISDNSTVYYKVSFRENLVDTTDDWFQRTAGGIYFGKSLVGNYSLFLPAKIDSVQGCFISAGATVSYHFYDSLVIGGSMFYRVFDAHYSMPILHGFDEITFADSIGIVRMIDHTGRWPITYLIDSSSVSGTLRRF